MGTSACWSPSPRFTIKSSLLNRGKVQVDKSFKQIAWQVIKTVLSVYLLTFIVFGIIFDPNGVNFFERSHFDMAKIFLIGMVMSVPFGIMNFWFAHPIPITLGIGFLFSILLSWFGRNEAWCFRVFLCLLGTLAAVGTVQFCLMA